MQRKLVVTILPLDIDGNGHRNLIPEQEGLFFIMDIFLNDMNFCSSLTDRKTRFSVICHPALNTPLRFFYRPDFICRQTLCCCCHWPQTKQKKSQIHQEAEPAANKTRPELRKQNRNWKQRSRVSWDWIQKPEKAITGLSIHGAPCPEVQRMSIWAFLQDLWHSWNIIPKFKTVVRKIYRKCQNFNSLVSKPTERQTGSSDDMHIDTNI